MDDKLKIPLWLNIVLLVIFAAVLLALTVEFGPTITNLVSSPEEFRGVIKTYKGFGVFIFMFFQAIQVIIAVIPGEFVQIAGGYLFGTIWGTVYSILGILIGTTIAYSITRWLGYPIVKVFVPKKHLKRLDFLINSEKCEIVMFVLFLIPGIPKDMLVYISGLTPVKPFRFFLIFIVARFPALFASSYVGANMYSKNYIGVIIVSIAACILFMLGILRRQKIVDKLEAVARKRDFRKSGDKK